ncbi:MAG TPA: SgcJ/EcaC family oxidoreductase [Gemmatimonadaceae bacterium]
MHRAQLGSLLLVVVFSPATAASPQESDRLAIRRRTEEYVQAFNRGDAAAAAAVYAADGTHTYAFGVTHRGRPAIEQGLREFLAGPMKGTRVSITVDSIRFITGEIAVEEDSFVVSGLTSADGAAVPSLNGRCMAVYRKQSNAWHASAIQCMVPMSPPRSAPKQGA